MKFKKVIFIFGPPASGKDTQAKFLAKRLKGKRLTTSEILKKFLESKKKYLIIGKQKIDLVKARNDLNSGKLVNFNLVTYVVIEKIKTSSGTLIFAGSPRSVTEAKGELNFLIKNKIPFNFIFLKVNYKVALKRALGRQRQDLPLDAPKIFLRRWRLFEKYTLAARNFLKNRGKLLEIDGNKPVKQVYQEIIQKMGI